jgi:hypothetical protein
VSAACAPLPEETSASAPSVASSTVMLAGVELSGPLGATIRIEEGGDWSAQSLVIEDGGTLRHYALTLWGSVTRTSLASAQSGSVGEGWVSDSWCAELRFPNTHPTPDWRLLHPVRGLREDSIELDAPEIPDDLGRESGPNGGAYRPFAIAASGADIAIAWGETDTGFTLLRALGAVVVTLSNASTDQLQASSSLTLEDWIPCDLHALCDWNSDGRPELALTGEMCRGDHSRECWTVEVVVLDGASLAELARVSFDLTRVVEPQRLGATWTCSTPNVVGFALSDGEGQGPMGFELDVRRGQVLRTWGVDAAELASARVADAAPAVCDSLAVRSWASSPFVGFRGGNRGSYRWAVVGKGAVVTRGDDGAVSLPLESGSVRPSDAWWLPDWDGDGQAEVLCTDEVSGLAVHPSRRPGESLHLLAPQGWTVDGLGSSVVIHEGRVLLSTAAVRHADNSRWRAVFELRPRTAAPGPVGR